jgi:hypothetical protein
VVIEDDASRGIGRREHLIRPELTADAVGRQELRPADAIDRQIDPSRPARRDDLFR